MEIKAGSKYDDFMFLVWLRQGGYMPVLVHSNVIHDRITEREWEDFNSFQI